MNETIGWKNGEWKNLNDIYLTIKDRGLRFSDGIFETILIRENKPILLNEHLKRFKNNLKILNFNITIKKTFLERIIYEGINKLNINKNQYGSIRINYTRGINMHRSIKIDSLNKKLDINNLWIEFYLIKVNTNPISVHISEYEKRNEKSLISQCKTFNYNQSIQALIEAKKNNFDDSLLLNTRDELCCGSTFNIILRRNDQWLTPRKKSGCLPGIMVNKLLELKLIKEAYLKPKFQKNDILIAINSLSCRQIKKVNSFKFNTNYDTKYFWDILFI
tara:strand:+ start:10832 stop:11659 length:828 start_codon:yes stop_codon:yes gene_type:complete